MNVFTFTGNLGRDVEVKNVSGTTVASFAVAVKAGFGDKQTTTWVSCNWWGKPAEGRVINYLKKGQQVAVTGELSTREYAKKDGGQGFTVDVRVNSLTLCGGRDAAPQQAVQQMQAPQNQMADDFDMDIPF